MAVQVKDEVSSYPEDGKTIKHMTKLKIQTKKTFYIFMKSKGCLGSPLEKVVALRDWVRVTAAIQISMKFWLIDLFIYFDIKKM